MDRTVSSVISSVIGYSGDSIKAAPTIELLRILGKSVNRLYQGYRI